MAETVRYALLGKEDIKTEPRNGTFEVTLADGSRVTLGALDVAYFLADAYAKASLPSSGLAAGQLARVIDNIRGLWQFQGSQWFGVAGEWLNVREFGATGDGSTNDTTPIQAALDAVPSLGGTVYFPPGTYIVSATNLTPKANTRLLGAGNRVSTVKVASGEQNLNAFYVNAKADVTFENLGIQGASKVSDTTGTNYRNGNGIRVNASTHLVIRGCYFTKCHNGIMDEDSTRKVLIIGNEFLIDHRAQSCVQFRGTAESAIIGNFFDQNVTSANGVEKGGIWIVNGANSVSNVTIQANHFSDNMSPAGTFDALVGVRKLV